MKISTERIPDAQVVMTIEVDDERLEQARQKAIRKLAPKAKVPGFRPGKAPPNMVRQYFGEDRVLDEALDIVVPDVYNEAIQSDESIEPIARPRLVVETTEPLVVKATIPVRPSVELGDYASIRVAVEPIVVDDERIEQAVDAIRKRAATVEPVDRPSVFGDIVSLDVNAAVAEETLLDQKDLEYQLVEGREGVPFPGFDEALVGHSKGETAEFDLTVASDLGDERFAGQEAHFVATLKEIKQEILPEFDAEFTKSVGEGFESPDALRQRIRDDILKAEEDQRNNRWHDEILGQIVERSTVEFPPVMLESEIDRIFHDQAGHMEKRDELERYLQAVGKTAEEIRGEIQPIAESRLRRSLVLGKVTEAENIEVTDEEVTAEIDTMVEASGPQGQQLRQLFDSENGRDTIRRNLVTRRSLERLVEIATQDGGAPAAEAEKPKKKRAAKKSSAESVSAPAEDAGDQETT